MKSHVMVRPSSTEDDNSVSTYYGGANANVSSHYSSYSTSKWKVGKPNNTELLLKLFGQRDDWRKYGDLTEVCYGTFILAPVKLWWWMSEIFVLVTVILFSYEFFFINWIVLVPALILAIIEWMAFFKTCLKDPGVMPRPTYPEAVKNLVSVLATWTGGPGTKRLVEHPNGQQEELHYCWRCHHFRSTQTSHCGTCDCCMILHDHHCPVFGGCVAKNNLSSFHTMIITMALFWLYMLGICVYTISGRPEADAFKSGTKVDGRSRRVLGPDGTPMTLYLIMAEIVAVVVIPLIVKCIREIFCTSCKNTQQYSIPSKSKEVIDEILEFARKNNFTLQEGMQLTEILEVKDGATEDVGIGSQDLNHNSFYAKPHTPVDI